MNSAYMRASCEYQTRNGAKAASAAANVAARWSYSSRPSRKSTGTIAVPARIDGIAHRELARCRPCGRWTHRMRWCSGGWTSELRRLSMSRASAICAWVIEVASSSQMPRVTTSADDEAGDDQRAEREHDAAVERLARRAGGDAVLGPGDAQAPERQRDDGGDERQAAGGHERHARDRGGVVAGDEDPDGLDDRDRGDGGDEPAAPAGGRAVRDEHAGDAEERHRGDVRHGEVGDAGVLRRRTRR